METEEIAKMLEETAEEIDGKKKLPCAKAFALSQVNGIPLSDIGKICNEKGIKIAACQLGCFE